MVANPRALTFLALAATLLALGGFVSYQTVFAAEVGAVSYPGDETGFLVEGIEEPIPPAPAEESLPVTARVELEVWPRARLVPNQTPAVFVVRGFGRRQERVARGEFVAGAAALPVLPTGELRGAHLVRVPLAGAQRYRVVRVTEDGEPIEIRLTDGATYHGRVVDQAAAPVPDARVWLGGIDGGRTDADGRFVVDGIRSAEGLPLVVRADGFAHYYAEVGIAEGSASQVHVLDRGVDVRVQLAARLPTDSGAKARVHLVPASAGYVPYPWFWSALPIGQAEYTLDERGSRRLRGLPRGRSLRVIVHHPELATDFVQCAPRHDGEVIVVRGRIASPWSGVVTTAASSPEGTWVLAQASRSAPLIEQRQALGQLVAPVVFVARQGATRCGADGKFVLGARQERRGQTLYLRAGRPDCMTAILAAKGHVGGRGVEFALPRQTPASAASGADSASGTTAIELEATALAAWAGLPTEGRILFRSEAGAFGPLPRSLRLAGDALVDLRLTCTPEDGGPAKVLERKRLPLVGTVNFARLLAAD